MTKWNAPEIAALNKGVALPNKDILVVHRTDGSGTTYIFTDYLTSVSPAWASGPGKGKDVKWAVGLGGAQNAGVMGQVSPDPGFDRLRRARVRARQNKVPFASLKNAAGKFIEPSIESVTAAAAGVAAKLPREHGFPRVDRQLAGAGCVSDRVVHVLARAGDIGPTRGSATSSWIS